MNYLRKFVFIVGVIAGSSSLCLAQFGQVEAYITGSAPMGDFGADEPGMNAGFGLGGSISAGYFFDERILAGLEVGYIRYDHFRKYNGENEEGSYSIAPLQLRGTYHLDPAGLFDLYAGAGAGVFWVDRSFSEAEVHDILSESAALFGLSPEVGASFKLSSTIRFSANLTYHYILGNQTTEMRTRTITVNGMHVIEEVETEVGFPDISALNINLGASFLLFN